MLQKMPRMSTRRRNDSRRTLMAFPDHKDKDSSTRSTIAISSSYIVARRVAAREMEIKVNHRSKSLDLYMDNPLGAVKVCSVQREHDQQIDSCQGTAFGNGSTPAHQRTRLPVATPQTDRHSQYGLRPVRQSSQSNLAHVAAPPTRQPLGAMSANVVQGGGGGFHMGIGGGDGGAKQRKHRVPLMAPTYSTR